ncbi:hypothetical protein MLD38_009924 [Melastoma candidum]|uniref:Uncharacterized protein n=1 Tax=Melastoma candidum TaxID=119954 RepID=A0ACB9QY71_9MYRT|nr:hypothetical protein MLD38_009924 [Melastoma candidum]
MDPGEAAPCSCSVIGCTAPSSPLTSSCRSRRCSCLARLVTTLNKCRKMVEGKGRSRNSRQASFQCRYDPLSYALNFDSGGRGGNYEDYYRFCAFTNRFLTRPTTTAAASASAATPSATPVLAVSH